MKIKNILMGLLPIFFQTSWADTISNPMNISANLNASCTLTLASNNLPFGTIQASPTGFAASNRIIQVFCNNGTSYNVNFGAGSSNNMLARSMNGTGSNTDKLIYNLYTSSARTTVYGDGTNGTVSISNVANGLTPQNYFLYGTIFLNQYITPDTYTDVVPITVVF